jgi:hypothetical protein
VQSGIGGDFSERGRKGWLLLHVKLKPILCFAGRVGERVAGKTKHLRPTRFILNHCYFTRAQKTPGPLQLGSTCSCQERFVFSRKFALSANRNNSAGEQRWSEKFIHAVWHFGRTSIFQGAFPPGCAHKSTVRARFLHNGADGHFIQT